MGIYAIKPRFQKTLEPVVIWCVNNGVSATALNGAGLVVALLIAGCIVVSDAHSIVLLLVPVFAFVRTASNALDGLVSRREGNDSPYGTVLNETLDRLSDAAIFLSFLTLPSIDARLVAVTVALILLASYLAIAVKAAGGPRLYMGIVGKADRMIYLSLAALAVFGTGDVEWFTILFLFLAMATTATFIERLFAARRALVP